MPFTPQNFESCRQWVYKVDQAIKADNTEEVIQLVLDDSVPLLFAFRNEILKAIREAPVYDSPTPVPGSIADLHPGQKNWVHVTRAIDGYWRAMKEVALGS